MELLANTDSHGIGVVFGTLLLITGLMVGIIVGRRIVAGSETSLNEYHVTKLLRGLFHWTDGFKNDVHRYRQMVDSLNQEVCAAEQQPSPADPALVMRFLSQIVQANDLLKQRLDHAEQALKEQAAEITSYMSEARTDALTGLLNRRVFDQELARRVTEFRRQGTSISVMIVDVDYFKRFNDRFGHLAGDAVLIRVAEILRETMRETDLVTRIGGEEFAAILPNTDVAEACRVAERTREAIEDATFKYEGKSMRVTVSCGVARLESGESAQAIVKRADQALYASKAAGRNFAHWHNGQVPMPITSKKSDQAAQAKGGNSEPVKRDTQLEEYTRVCELLREKLTSVISQHA